MRITWKDGVTTLAAAGAVALERAHSYDWNLPLIADARWAIAGVAVLAVVGYVFSYLLDTARSQGWSTVAIVLGVIMLGLTALGLIVGTSDYVFWLMLSVVAFWAASIIRHLTIPTPMTHSRV